MAKTIIGLEEVMKELRLDPKRAGRNMDKLLARMAVNTHSEAVNSINNGGRTGSIYTRGSVSHQASAPGEPPKTDTGDLVSNITFEKDSTGYTVGSRKGAPHGFWLEMGTHNISPRPWLKPAHMKTLKKFRQFIGRFR